MELPSSKDELKRYSGILLQQIEKQSSDISVLQQRVSGTKKLTRTLRNFKT